MSQNVKIYSSVCLVKVEVNVTHRGSDVILEKIVFRS
jgi:hypothetical protein